MVCPALAGDWVLRIRERTWRERRERDLQLLRYKLRKCACFLSSSEVSLSYTCAFCTGPSSACGTLIPLGYASDLPHSEVSLWHACAHLCSTSTS